MLAGNLIKFHMPNIDQQCYQSISVSTGQVKAELLRIKVEKSVNTDDFSPWITRKFAAFLCEPLTDIINTMFYQHKYPALWKMTEVVPLPKMKTPQRTKDYLPISLLFHCGRKVLYGPV